MKLRQVMREVQLRQIMRENTNARKIITESNLEVIARKFNISVDDANVLQTYAAVYMDLLKEKK